MESSLIPISASCCAVGGYRQQRLLSLYRGLKREELIICLFGQGTMAWMLTATALGFTILPTAPRLGYGSARLRAVCCPWVNLPVASPRRCSARAVRVFCPNGFLHLTAGKDHHRRLYLTKYSTDREATMEPLDICPQMMQGRSCDISSLP